MVQPEDDREGRAWSPVSSLIAATPGGPLRESSVARTLPSPLGDLARRTPRWLPGALLGVAMFLAVMPPSVLDPRNVRWLFVGDAGSHYLGWAFFRADAWQWPPGATWRYGEAMASSIVYSDSIPLLALALKPFSSVLPAEFQYSGWWILASMALTGAFGWRIGDVATRSEFGAFVAAGLAVLSPILIQRATAHYALMAHWLILWSLLGYLVLPRSLRATGLPLWVAALTHAYLLLIVLAVWCSEQVRFVLQHRLLARRSALARFVARDLAVILLLAGVLQLAGYFELPGGSVGGDLYGRFALNLNSFVNPRWVSTFLPGRPAREGAEFEGFAYLGLGALALAAIGGLGLLASPGGRADLRRLGPLLVVTLLLAGFALSHEVYLDDHEVLRIPWPRSLLLRFGTFRASGRMAWALYYAVLMGGALSVLRRFPRRAAVAIVASAMILQVVDLVPHVAGMRRFFTERYERGEGLESPEFAAPEWERIGARYRHLHVVPMENMAPNHFRLGLFAARHGMTINVGYFSRVPGLEPGNAALLERVRRGDWELDTVYVLNDPSLVSGIPRGADDALLERDGMWVLAPGFGKARSEGSAERSQPATQPAVRRDG